MGFEWQTIEDEKEDIFNFNENGQSLQGTLLSVEEGGNNKIFTITDGQKTTKFWGSAVLNSKLSHCKVGDIIKINYLGRKPGEKGYKMFEVQKKVMNASVEHQRVQ